MARLIALDVGVRRVGVAVCDEMQMIARPIEIIDVKTQNAFERITQHLTQYAPEAFVIGYPLHVNGTRGEQSLHVDQFIEQLKAHSTLPIYLQDERYSSGEAQELIKMKQKKTKSPSRARKPQIVRDDALAAAVILQRFLDEKHQVT